MKKFRKLLPAFGMLLLSSALLSTSSYAWFSMNSTVKTDGMNVQATTSQNLVISNSSKTSYLSSATATYTGTNTLAPASTSMTGENGLKSGNFYTVKEDKTINYDDGTITDDTDFELCTVTPNADNNHVATHTFYVKVDAKDASASFGNLYVSNITVKSGTDESSANISKALRIGIVSGAKYHLFAPIPDTDEDDDSYKGILGGAVASTYETLSVVGTTATLGSVGVTETLVTVYIWYEGQDENCTSANSINVEELSVSISFSAI